MKYSIVIPTYNHCDDLLKPCVEAILKYSVVSDIELVISANGCKDNTFEYLGSLKEKFVYLGLEQNLKIVWNPDASGYAKATNDGIEVSTTDLIVLLNNDAFLLPQNKNDWLKILEAQFTQDEKCGISCVIRSLSEPAGRDFAVFFCVMIHRKVFDKIGLLPLDYGMGGGEDTEFCIETENAGFTVSQAINKTWSEEIMLYVGDFPIYHRGEATVHDASLVPDWNNIFLQNSITLAKKYNPKWYQWKVSNNAERGVFFKGDDVYPREQTRYKFAKKNLLGKKVLEIGCSNGYGIQFLPKNVEYTGMDNDIEIIRCADYQQWRDDAKFLTADINSLVASGSNMLGYYDTIIAFESIEHIHNGLKLVQKLKQHCDKMIITVPFNENPGQFSPHHVNHNLTVDSFPGFKEIGLIDIDGNIIDHSNINPNAEYNLLMVWETKSKGKLNYKKDLDWLTEQHNEIYSEVIKENCYEINSDDIAGRCVLDIGANIGAFSILAGYLGAKKVIAVEPISSTYDSLLKNIDHAKLKNIVPLKNIVSDVSGNLCNISLNVNSGHNSMYNVGERFETVETITLSDLLDKLDSDNILLKLDCEGAEYDIILNATEQEMARIDSIALEIHMDLHPKYKGAEILGEKLTAFGFKQYDVKQIFSWWIDANGNMVDMKPIPYRIELWKK